MNCSSVQHLRIYRGLDNTEHLLVTDGNGDAVSLAGVTKVQLEVGGEVFDSSVLGSGAIWWTDTETYRGETVDVVKLKLGNAAPLANLTESDYANGELRLFDGANPNGYQALTELRVLIV